MDTQTVVFTALLVASVWVAIKAALALSVAALKVTGIWWLLSALGLIGKSQPTRSNSKSTQPIYPIGKISGPGVPDQYLYRINRLDYVNIEVWVSTIRISSEMDLQHFSLLPISKCRISYF